ncbi:MAG TPA: hypothetical protein VKS25_01250 [Solirubrobacteraceae bacterium]|nr:hypothetical protein [Solirubrobacteraceae bacterium]
MLLLEFRDRRHAPADQPEALIEEARRRSRLRRRRRTALAALVLGAAAALGYWVTDSGGPGIVAQGTTAPAPFVNLRAFAGHGELAFVSRGVAWALDGEPSALRRMPEPTGWTASEPLLSHDGRWLAYVTAASTVNSPTPVELWIAHGDGSGAHVVVGLDDLVGWNPTADVLAATAGGRGSTLELIRPDGPTRTVVELSGGLARQGIVEGAAWSPDGRQIAVSTNSAGEGTVIRAYPIAGGAPTTWYRIGNAQRFPSRICSDCGGRETLAYLVGWWPRRGIGFWALCCGATRNLDQTPLALIARPGARPRVFAQALSTDGSSVAAGASGALAVDATTGGAGRVLGQGKTVEYCDAAALRCTPVPGATTWVGPDAQRCPAPTVRGPSCSPIAIPPAGQPGSGVSLEPAWSAGGTLLAYVRAPVLKCIPCSDAAWDAAHAIYVWNARTGTTRRIGSVDGASVPTWSSDGRDLLFVRDDGLWLQGIGGGAPIEIEHPLFASDAFTGPNSVDYFGLIPWGIQFSWWSS